MNKAIFLDRDGVLIEDLHYNCNIDKIYIKKEILPMLKFLQNQYKLIVITNQSGVARGKFLLKDVETFNKYMIEKFAKHGVYINDVFVCPHLVDGQVKEYSFDCNCRKPNIGLILEAKKKHNLDLSQSYMVGDKESDVLCGINAKLKNSFNINNISFDEILHKIKD